MNKRKFNAIRTDITRISALFRGGLIHFLLIKVKKIIVSLILFVLLNAIHYLCIYVKRWKHFRF